MGPYTIAPRGNETDIVQRTNVGMIQCGESVRFPFEALGELLGGNL
jgi:hypothetical protein